MAKKMRLYCGLLILMLVTLACGVSKDIIPTRTPGQVPLVQETLPPQVIPTKAMPEAPAPIPPSIKAPFEIDPDPYTHPSKTFTINPPLGWTLSENENGETSWTNAENTASLILAVTNVGTSLDMASFKSFVESREANFFAFFPGYEQTKVDDQSDQGNMWVYKSLEFEGVANYVASYYTILGQGVFQVDAWMALDQAESYSTKFDELLSTLQMDGGPAATLPIYNWIYVFYDRNNLYQIEAPVSWVYSESVSDDKTTYIDTHTAPDGHAVISNITYDDGRMVSKADAGQFALELLRNFYTKGVKDIKITGDKVQSDGSERLDWYSKSGNYYGVSFFETRGTTFLLFSTLYDEGFDFYEAPLNNSINTYKIP